MLLEGTLYIRVLQPALHYELAQDSISPTLDASRRLRD
jgi:hypothetical protein